MGRFWLSFGILLTILIAIQFIRPDQNLGERVTAEDFIQVTRVPDTLATVLLNSCYDCHSNRTQYPWYGNLAPLSWFLNQHIVQGKAHLNFSSWALYESMQQISQLEQICEECESGSMPLKSYVLIYRSASLSEAEIAAICDWTGKEALRLLKQE